MTTFVHCRGCGAQIHETAPMCPKCGAPQSPVVAVAGSIDTSMTERRGYAQVRWFRKRWFLILLILSVTPIAALISLTGDLYYLAKGTVKTFPGKFKVVIYLLSAGYVMTFLMPVGSSSQVLYFLAAIVVSLVMGFKR